MLTTLVPTTCGVTKMSVFGCTFKTWPLPCWTRKIADNMHNVHSVLMSLQLSQLKGGTPHVEPVPRGIGRPA